jgi:hypothetical protein
MSLDNQQKWICEEKEVEFLTPVVFFLAVRGVSASTPTIKSVVYHKQEFSDLEL